MSNNFNLEELFHSLKEKISAKDENSYTYQLAKAGLEKSARKVGEEAVEVIIAAFIHEKENNAKTRQDLINEICDLFYHSLVLSASQQIEFSEILEELNKRNNLKK
jgi:phosphoribosyl-ATP pyrophosphohydrolase